MEPRAKLALVGYGKMGRRIDELSAQFGFEVVQRITSSNATEPVRPDLNVAIEFSRPEMAESNLRRLIEARVPAVCGTTGWIDKLEAISEAVHRHETALVWSANFSVGVAVFRRLVGRAARLMADRDEYETWAWEVHHSAKKDAPSGTMLQLLRDMERAGLKSAVDVASNRAGKHPGTHEIGFDSAADTITLRHEARNRDGFAEGALRAARWVQGRQGVFTFEQVLFGEQEQ